MYHFGRPLLFRVVDPVGELEESPTACCVLFSSWTSEDILTKIKAVIFAFLGCFIGVSVLNYFPGVLVSVLQKPGKLVK